MSTPPKPTPSNPDPIGQEKLKILQTEDDIAKEEAKPNPDPEYIAEKKEYLAFCRRQLENSLELAGSTVEIIMKLNNIVGLCCQAREDLKPGASELPAEDLQRLNDRILEQLEDVPRVIDQAENTFMGAMG